MKICTKCNTKKPFSEFHLGKGPGGRHSWCKECIKVNRTKVYREDPESRDRHSLWSRYRLRPEDLQELLEKQNHTCLLCPKVFATRRDFHIDHVHGTFIVRGLLCGSCNTRLGWYEKRKSEILAYLA